MPIRLKNKDVIRSANYDVVHVLDLDIPLTRTFPVGGKAEFTDLVSRREAGEFGDFEWMLRVFCCFTRRLPQRDQVRYDFLSRQDLEPEELTAIVDATLTLLNFMNSTGDADAGEAEGNVEEPPKGGKRAPKVKTES